MEKYKPVQINIKSMANVNSQITHMQKVLLEQMKAKQVGEQSVISFILCKQDDIENILRNQAIFII